MTKEWMMYALELLGPNLLSKDDLRVSVVSPPRAAHPRKTSS